MRGWARAWKVRRRVRMAARRSRVLCAARRAAVAPRALGAGLAALVAFGPATSASGEPSSPARELHAGAPVVGCTSLANLRMVLRQGGGDPVALLALISDPRVDHGCAVVAPGTVTSIAEQISLNGNAYDCLALARTAICHWVVAGSVAPSEAGPGQTAPAGPASRPGKPKR